MMKKLFGLLTLLVVLSTGSVYAGETKNVIDELDYLSDRELSDLQEVTEDLINTTQLETVIVITADTKGKSSMAFADDYFDYNGYGVGEDHSGLLMLVNMDARELWISTTGHAIDIFTDERIASMVDDITANLSDEDYMGACQDFLKLVVDYSERGVPSGQYRKEGVTQMAEINPTYFDNVIALMSNFIVYIIALVIAIIATVVLTMARKGKVTINNLTYEEKGSFTLTNQQDIFLRQTVTQVKIETNNSGGSSTHSGSSGTSHGGGGGKF
ncbi:MAG: TPM domain-containing protein [Vallitaleaceae bacterium]|nr:TPM domain-containing protein [Vallitaleaceae bacterium]